MGMSEGGGDMKSEINVTPLVDVMLVLLVIFMITAPMLSTGIKLDLPEGTAAPDDQEDEDTLTLSIDSDRRVHLGETEVAWSELRTKLEKNELIKAKGKLYVEADTSLPYGVVIAAMDTAQAAGVTQLMMRTDPVDEEKRQELLRGLEGEPAASEGESPDDG